MELSKFRLRQIIQETISSLKDIGYHLTNEFGEDLIKIIDEEINGIEFNKSNIQIIEFGELMVIITRMAENNAVNVRTSLKVAEVEL